MKGKPRIHEFFYQHCSLLPSHSWISPFGGFKGAWGCLPAGRQGGEVCPFMRIRPFHFQNPLPYSLLIISYSFSQHSRENSPPNLLFSKLK